MPKSLITKHIIEQIVKPSVDETAKKKTIEEVRNIFQDAGSIDFNSKETHNSLVNLAKAFQTVFTAAGNTEIDFTQMINTSSTSELFTKLGQIAGEKFQSAWNNAIQNFGNNNLDLSPTGLMKQLDKRKNDLSIKKEKSYKKLQRYEDLSDLKYMIEGNSIKPFSLKEIESKEIDVDEFALSLKEAFIEAETQLTDVTRGTKEYYQLLIHIREIILDMYRMAGTIEKHPNIIKDKEILEDYDYGNLDDMTIDAIKGTQKDFNKYLSKYTEFHEKSLKSINIELEQIAIKEKEITQNNPELIDQKKATAGLKTLNEVEEAYTRILNKERKGKKSVNVIAEKNILSAIDYKSGEKSLLQLSRGYTNSINSGENWEVQYQWLVKFVREYESYAAREDAETAKLSKYKALYEQLKPMAANAENMLRNVLNMANNIPLVGMGGSEDLGKAEAEAKAKADKEAAEAARLSAEEAEKERLAQDRIIETIEEKRNVLESLQKRVQQSLYDQNKNMYIATQEELDKAKEELIDYEKILVKTAGGKNLTLGPDMPNQDMMKFLGMDTQKAKSIEFIRKETIAHQENLDDSNYKDNDNLKESIITEEEVRKAEADYDRLSKKLNTLQEEGHEAAIELEKLSKRAQIYGFGSDKTALQESRIQTTLAKDNRGQYVVDMLKKGYETTKTPSGEYGFDRPDLGKGVFTKITKTEYDYAQYLSQKIKELNVGWDEGLKILKSQNGQLEAAKIKVSTINSEYEKTKLESEKAYEAQAEVHSKWNKQQKEKNTVNDSDQQLKNIKKLITYIDEKYLSIGKHLSDFLSDAQGETREFNEELKNILSTLNLIDEKGNLKFDIKNNGEDGSGTTHNGALISDDFVLIERGNYQDVKNSKLPSSTQNAYEDGINVAKVLGYVPSKYNNSFFDVQSVAKGKNLFENGVISQNVINATNEQIQQLINAFIKARDYGFNIENGGSNIVYDKEKGFSFYDLEEMSSDDTDFWNKLSEDQKKLYAIDDLFSLFSGLNRDHTNFENDTNVQSFAERIKQIIADNNIISKNAYDSKGRNYEDIFDDIFLGDNDGYDLDKYLSELKQEIESSSSDEIDSNNQKIKSYEELCAVIERLNTLRAKDQSSLTTSESNEIDDILAQIRKTKGTSSPDKMVNDLLQWSSMMTGSLPIDENKMAQYLGIEIPQAAQKAEDAVDELNNSLKETNNLNQGSGTGDASSADLKSAQDKAEQLSKKLTDAESENKRPRDEYDAYTRASMDEKNTLQNDLNAANEQIKVAQSQQAQAEQESLKKDATIQDLKDQLAKTKTSSDGSRINDTDNKTEINDLEKIGNQLGEITNKVNEKTQAFRDESDVVDNIVTSEVSSLEKLENKIIEIKSRFETLLSDISTKQPDICTPDVNTQAFVAEGEAAESAINKENQALQTLRASLQLTTQRINTKTDAFVLEGKTVGQVVGKEISALKNLQTNANNVNKTVLDLIKNLRLTKTATKYTQPKTQSSSNSQSSNTTPGAVSSKDYAGEAKIREQSILKLRAELMTTGKLTKGLEQGLDHLFVTASQITDKASFNNWNRVLSEITNNIKIKGIFDKANDKDETSKYEKLVALKQQEYDLEVRLLNAKGTTETAVLQNQLQQTRALVQAQDRLTKGSEQDVKLKQQEAEWERKIEQLRASKKDYQESQTQKEQEQRIAQKLKEQQKLVKELIPLYKQLGEARAKGENTQGIRKSIKDKRSNLNSTKNIENRFLSATNEGYDKSRSKVLSDLGKLYENRDKLRANYESNGRSPKDLVNLKLLSEEIDRRKKNLQLTQQETEALRKKGKIAYDAQKRVNQASEQKKYNDAAWNQQKKSARVRSGVNLANSAVSTGSKAVMSVIGEKDLNIEIETKARELQNAIKVLDDLKKASLDNLNRGIAVDTDELARQISEVNKLTDEMNELLKIHQKFSGDNSKVISDNIIDFNGLDKDSEEYKRRLQSVAEGFLKAKLQSVNFNATTGELTGKVRTGTNEFTEYAFAVDKVDGKIKQLNNGSKKTEGFFSGVSKKMKEAAQYVIGSVSIYDLWNQIRQGIQYVKEIDSALTELKKVTDETEATYDRFLNTAAKTADKVGSTIKEVVSSTADFARVGYSLEDAVKLSETAQILMNTSEYTDISSASDALISALKSFGYGAQESLHVVDIFNEIGGIIADVYSNMYKARNVKRLISREWTRPCKVRI